MPPKTEFESFDSKAETIPREFALSFSFWVNATELKDLKTSAGGTGFLSNAQNPQHTFVAIIISSKLP